MSKYFWILDNGHGNNTKGKKSPVLPNGLQFFEWEFNRNITHRVAQLLHKDAIEYHLLVPEETDISLKERVRRANTLVSDKKKLLVSIHANAAGSSKVWSPARGMMTFYHKTSTVGKQMATVFQQEIIKSTGWKDRGIKYSVTIDGKEITLAMTRDTKMPAILTENGFYTNQDECLLLMSDEIRQGIATAHYKGIKQLDQSLDY
jgi:N-acetylmuramoyl-L-alanine amidase